MSQAPQPHSYESLEEAASVVIGKIVFAFSSFEFNLGLCLRSEVAAGNAELVNPLVERLSFKHKLDALLEVVTLKHSADPASIQAFKNWHRTMDAFRAKRNSFVHGRWGIQNHAGKVVNVSPGMPSAEPQREVAFTLEELQAELSELRAVVKQFQTLREQWRK